jgi:hypothetical protein
MSLAAAIGWSGVIVGVGLSAWAARYYLTAMPTARDAALTSTASAPPPSLTPIERSLYKQRAWTTIVPRLDEADRLSRTAVNDQLAEIDHFFSERRAGVKLFAGKVLSLSGKWNYAKSKLPIAADDAHLRYVAEQFASAVFSDDDLRKAIQAAVDGYLGRVAAIEGRLLVDVRADLSEQALKMPAAPRLPVSEAELRRQFETSLADVTRLAARDVGRATSLTTASLVGGEIATVIAVRVAAAVAVRLGVSAGIVGAGAASSWATFGVGIVVGFAVDAALNKAAKAAGYDPAAAVEQRVNAVLDDVRKLIVEGDSESKYLYDRLSKAARDDADPAAREQSARSAEEIRGSGNLGLRRELLRLHEERAALRRAALRRVIFSGEPG